MRILLTGGSGFIGRNIVEQLGGKYTIYAPSHRELDLTQQEQVDGFFAAQEVDAVIHAAIKPGHRNASDTTNLLETDLRMYYNLVRNTEPRGKRLLLLGSGCCYDMRHYTPKMAEGAMGTHIPVDDTGFAKYIASSHALTTKHVYDLRVFGIYGKYEEYAIRFISNALCKALYGLPITLRQNRLFDYLYIDDFVRIVDEMLERELLHHAYNLTPNHAVGLLELAELSREIAGADVPIHVGAEGMGLPYSGDNARFTQEFPRFKFTPHREAIAQLCAWYRERKDSIDRSLLLTDK